MNVFYFGSILHVLVLPLFLFGGLYRRIAQQIVPIFYGFFESPDAFPSRVPGMLLYFLPDFPFLVNSPTFPLLCSISGFVTHLFLGRSLRQSWVKCVGIGVWQIWPALCHTLELLILPSLIPHGCPASFPSQWMTVLFVWFSGEVTWSHPCFLCFPHTYLQPVRKPSWLYLWNTPNHIPCHQVGLLGMILLLGYFVSNWPSCFLCCPMMVYSDTFKIWIWSWTFNDLPFHLAKYRILVKAPQCYMTCSQYSSDFFSTL